MFASYPDEQPVAVYDNPADAVARAARMIQDDGL